MYHWILNILLGVLLGISAWIDIRKKIVSDKILVLSFCLGIVVFLIFQPFTILWAAGGTLIGMLVMGISKLTKGQIGMGDGKLLCVTGIYLGVYKNLELFFTALLLASIWGIIVLMIRKADRKTELPFVPFLMMAYVVMTVTQVAQISGL